MEYKIADVKNGLRRVSSSVIAAKMRLEQIDSSTGDGDLGISMQKGAMAIKAVVDAYGDPDIGRLFTLCAMELNKAAPSTMGTLLSAGLMQAGRRFAKCETLGTEQLMALPGVFADTIQMRGKASEGDRTILDALLPMRRAFESAESLSQAITSGLEAAKLGADRTKDMVPKIGRAKWAPENAKGIPDGGAVLCTVILEALAAMQENALYDTQ